MRYIELLEKKHLTTDSPEFKNWFSGSKVVDQNGIPLPVYHGTGRPDRVGKQFRKNRATAGPMAYFTDSPRIASNYALSKPDTSRTDDSGKYQDWFLVKVPGYRKEISIDRMWYILSLEEKNKIATLAPKITKSEESEQIILDDTNNNGLGAFQQHLKDARGNVLMALVDEWLLSGNLFGDEDEFVKVLKLAGFNRPIRIFDPNSTIPFVYKVYLSIKNPLISTNIPKRVLDTLSTVANNQKSKNISDFNMDMWVKKTQNAKEWFRDLLDDIEITGGKNSWTVIPDWVTKTLESFGYDGIHDIGGKNIQSYDHSVWIPFYETQVKSAISNYGYDPTKKNIHESMKLLENRIDFLKQKYIPRIHKALENGNFNIHNQITPLSNIILQISGPEIEATIDDLLKNKQWEQLAGHVFDAVVSADPNPQKKNTQWLLNLVLKTSSINGRLKLEDLDKAKYYLTLFEKNKQNLPVEDRNLLSYADIHILYAVVQNFKTISKREEKKYYAIEMLKQSRLVMDSPQYRILIPLTQEASCYFGINTEWCTAATGSYNYFDSYNRDGPLYNILEKKTNTRWQYHMQSGQFNDEHDKAINVERFYRNHYAAARAIADDIVNINSQYYEKLSENQIIIKKWVSIYECIEDIGTKDARNYYEYYISDDAEPINIDSQSYSNDYARELLAKMKKQHEGIFSKLGQYFYNNYIKHDDALNDYDVSTVNGILDLVDEIDDEDFKNTVENASRDGQETGAENEAIKLFKNIVSQNPHLYFSSNIKNVEILPIGTKVAKNVDKNEQHNWVGDFQWDAPIAFIIHINDIAERLDKLSDISDITEMAESFDAIINIEEPYNGFTDFDDDAAYDRFVDEINELI